MRIRGRNLLRAALAQVRAIKEEVFVLVWFWCSCCERVFYGSYPDVSPTDIGIFAISADDLEKQQLCPFELCKAQGDVRLWRKVLPDNPSYPVEPLYGVRYPLSPTTEDMERIAKVHEFVEQLSQS